MDTGRTEAVVEDDRKGIVEVAGRKEYVVDLLNVRIVEWEVLCLL